MCFLVQLLILANEFIQIGDVDANLPELAICFRAGASIWCFYLFNRYSIINCPCTLVINRETEEISFFLSLVLLIVLLFQNFQKVLNYNLSEL